VLRALTTRETPNNISSLLREQRVSHSYIVDELNTHFESKSSMVDFPRYFAAQYMLCDHSVHSYIDLLLRFIIIFHFHLATFITAIARRVIRRGED